MHPNYRFVLEKSKSLLASPKGRVLDYGCGAGEIVVAGRETGLDIFGVEVFYDGEYTRSRVRESGLLGKEIREIVSGCIPFPDGYFDLVVSNQVLEHVPDLGAVLKEIQRVLRPGGKFFCLFPSREVIREAHCGIPFVHWFPVGARIRYPWMVLFRSLGLGYDKGGKSAHKWASDFLECLDKFTFYRNYIEIRRTFLDTFSTVEHIEEDYIAFRLEKKRCTPCARLSRAAPAKYVSRWVCRRIGGLVLVATKA